MSHIARSLALLLVLTPPSSAVVYHVAGGRAAVDGTDGSQARPFPTIGQAVAKLQPGDTVLIQAGEYRGAVSINVSGTAEQPITIAAAPGDEGRVVILGSDPAAEVTQIHGLTWQVPWRGRLAVDYPDNWVDYGELSRRCEIVSVDGRRLRQVLARGELKRGTFWVDREQGAIVFALREYGRPQRVEVGTRQRGVYARGSHLQFRGLTVRWVANGFANAAFDLIGSDNTVEGCRAEENNLDGFRWAGRRLRAVGNEGSRNGRCGISGSFHDSLLEDNTTDDNGWRFGPEWHSGGMKIVGGAPSNNRILRHRSRRNNGRGIWFDFACRGNRVEGCELADNLIAGLEFEACLADNWAVNNLVRGTRIDVDSVNEHGTGAGILLYESDGTRVYHNTILDNERCGILIAGGRRSTYDGVPAVSRNTRIVNNIIAGNQRAGLVFWVWSESAEEPALRSHHSDYNLWRQLPGTPLVMLPKGDRAADLPAWRDALGQDAHSLSAEPRLDGDTGRYRPRPDSVAIDAGVTLEEVERDAVGSPRTNGPAPDLGWLEIR